MIVLNKQKIDSMKSRLILLMIGVVVWALFLFCYFFLIAPDYSYSGLSVRLISRSCWVWAGVLSLTPLIWLPIKLQRPSDFTVWFLYLFIILPAPIVILMSSPMEPEPLVNLLGLLIISFGFMELFRIKMKINIPSAKPNASIFEQWLPVITIVFSIIVLALCDFKFDLSVAHVYDRREAAREIVATQGAYAGYVAAFLKSVCLPIMVALGILRGKIAYYILAFLAIVALFSFAGTKGTLFAPLVIGFIVFLNKRKKARFGYTLLGWMTVLLTAAIIEYQLIGKSMISAIIIRREMAVTTQITGYIWDYFQTHPLVLMRDSIVGTMMSASSPYGMPTARMIGSVYFGSPDYNANANIWASAYADFGWIGMIVVSVVSGTILNIVDSMCAKGKFLFASICCGVMGTIWTNGSLHTSLISNGVIFLVLAIWFYPERLSVKQIQA